MAANRDILAFALKWLSVWEDRSSTWPMLEDVSFAENCFALGFEMDCGHSFIEMYSYEAFTDTTHFQAVQNQINDIAILASGIHSHWRDITHWSYVDITSEEQRTWFIAALTRLAELASAPGR